jgi:hypothetical protein
MNETHRRGERNRYLIMAFSLLLSVYAFCRAEKQDVKLDFSGYTAMQAGEIVRGQYKNAKFNNRWQERFLGGFTIEATVNQRLRIAFGPECMITQAIYDNPDNKIGRAHV